MKGFYFGRKLFFPFGETVAFKKIVRSVQRRNIYSITGEWPKHITPDILKQIEAHWKKSVAEPVDTTDLTHGNAVDVSKKKYILSMFPYPSGSLHMGHVRVYTIADILSRYYRMKGYKVIHPMGWDAFGLPAENAAIEHGTKPGDWTKSNIENMRNQLHNLGCCFDWSREIATCDPNYYRWTQFIFIKLFKAGLAYREEAQVNWDPIDETVLADEQVDENGCSWRSGAKVEKKMLKQWFIKTTRFSEALYNDLDDPSLDDWKDISLLQKHWIGECDWYAIQMKLLDGQNSVPECMAHLRVSMKYPEHIEKISFLAIKPGHPLDKEKYYGISKNGIKTLKVRAVDPLYNRKLPIIVYEDLPYYEGADVYVCKLRTDSDQVILDALGLQRGVGQDGNAGVEENLEKRAKVVEECLKRNVGGYKCSSKLRDWLISRQRYWGTPIPMIQCNDCGTVPVPEEDLPVQLPKTKDFIKKGTNILKESTEWYNCECPKCGGNAKRETDTMDTFVDSSWYYLRYLDPRNSTDVISNTADRCMPVDIYVGGKEHAILHLYFARFLQKFLNSEGISSHIEPFKKLLTQGEVRGETYQVKSNGKFLRKAQVDLSEKPPVEIETGEHVSVYYDKMSKSKFNGINPQNILDEYGIDVTRLSIMSEYGPHSDRNWDNGSLDRSVQILEKLSVTVNAFLQAKKAGVNTDQLTPDEIDKYNEIIFDHRNKCVLFSTHFMLKSFMFHTSIKNIQTFINNLKLKGIPKEMITSQEYEKSLATVVILLHPFCPHLTNEMWDALCSNSELPALDKNIPLCDQPWPSIDESFKRDLDIDVNGETVCTIKLDTDSYLALSAKKAREIALKQADVVECMGKRPVLDMSFSHNAAFKAKIKIDTLTSQEMKKIKKEKKKMREAHKKST